MKDNAIIYMGTPDFAVEPLKRLIAESYHIAAVVTVADKPAGRGLKLHYSPVKQFAIEHNIPVLQPLKLNDPAFIEELKEFNADLFIVVAFRKLPEAVWKLPRLGCFNLHASLLPQYRGAAPINHAVINGETTTGVTTFFLNDEIDTGKIIKQREINIGPDETAGELHDRMMNIGADLVAETVEAIFSNNFTATDQKDKVANADYKKDAEQSSYLTNVGDNNIELKKAPKIFRNDCRINWQQDALEIHNFIRGLSPYPGSFSILSTREGESELKVLKSALTNMPNQGEAGNVIYENSKLLIGCSDLYLELLTVQPAGKKAMPSSDFLRGMRSEIISFV